LKTGEAFDYEHRVRRADGVYRWFHSRGTALRDAEGNIIRWYFLLTDIDGRKKAEENLRRSEAYLLEAQKLSQTGSFGWNAATGEMDLVGRNLSDLWLRPDHKSDFGTHAPADSSRRYLRCERGHRASCTAWETILILTPLTDA